jgi:hypothetical protein
MKLFLRMRCRIHENLNFVIFVILDPWVTFLFYFCFVALLTDIILIRVVERIHDCRLGGPLVLVHRFPQQV